MTNHWIYSSHLTKDNPPQEHIFTCGNNQKNRLTCHNQQIKRFFLYPEPGLRVSLTSLDAMIESEHVLRIRQTIESLLNQLSPKQREALLLRFVYEMEYDDIAVILDATPHAVRKFVSKGLGKLRKGRECGKTMKIAT